MKRICIVSPYGGEKDNQELAARFCRAVLDAHLAVGEKVAIYAPHLIYPWFLSDRSRVERKLAMAMARSFMEVCDEVWVLEPYTAELREPYYFKSLPELALHIPARMHQTILTPGMIDDIEYAKKLGKGVVTFHSIDDVEVGNRGQRPS